MFVDLVTIQWAGTPVFLVEEPCLLAKVLDYIRTTLWGRVWNKQGKLDLQTLIIFTGYIVSACTSQTLVFWLNEKHMVGKKVPSFISLLSLWVIKHLFLLTYLNTQQKLKSYLSWIYPFQFFYFTFFHFFCTCNMHYRIEKHGGKDKSMYPQIVRSSQDFAVFMTMPFVLY